MKSKKDHLLMIALGKGPKRPMPNDEPDGDEPDEGDDGMEYGIDGASDDDGDEGPEDGADEEEDSEDEDSIQCAHDLMDALDKHDAAGIVEAIKAIAGK